jgi:DNA polymerase-3 subunit delta
MDYNSIRKELKAKQYRPVYFLQGEEPYFIDKLTKHIENNVLEEHEKDFNQTIFYGKDSKPELILETAKRYPMMSEKQVVIVREAQHLKSKLGEFKEYLENPQLSTILVFNYKYGKLDGRTEIAKCFAQHCVFTSDKLKDYLVPDWIMKYVRSKGNGISQRSAVLLSEYLGNDLQKIAGEIDKLRITIEADANITSEDIQRNIGISKEYNVFELQNALLTRNVLKANQIIKYFASDPKSHPDVVTISVLFSLFQRLMKLHFALNKANDKALAKEIGVHPFFLKEYKSAGQFYTPKKLADIIHLLRIADMQTKGVGSVNRDPGELVKQLVYQILH